MRTNRTIRTSLPWALAVLGVFAPLRAQITQPTPFAAAGLRLEVDQREVKVGDSLTLTLEFRQVATGMQVQTREPVIATPSNFEITMKFSNSRIEMVDQATQVITTTRFRLTATQPGEETLGPGHLIFMDAQGQKHELVSNTATVKVVEKGSLFGGSPKPKEKKETAPPPPPTPTPTESLRDLKPLRPESHWILWSLFWVALLAAIGGFIFRILGRRKKAGPQPPPPLEDSIRLKEAWRKLGKEDLPSEDFCLCLSALVRECLLLRYGIPAPDLTTEEILEDLKGVQLFKEDREAAEKCLKACDRVLYAEGNLTGRDALRSAAQGLLPKKNG